MKPATTECRYPLMLNGWQSSITDVASSSSKVASIKVQAVKLSRAGRNFKLMTEH